jgi:hypothetical protein
MVPVNAPVEEFSVTPAGKDPLAISNFNGATPPALDIPAFTSPTLIVGRDVVMIFTAPAGFESITPEYDFDFVCDELSVTETAKL